MKKEVEVYKSNEPTMTVKELVGVLGVSIMTLNKVINQLFPNKMKHGITTRLNEREVVQVKTELQRNKMVSGIEDTPSTELDMAIMATKVITFYQEKAEMLRQQNQVLKQTTAEQADVIHYQTPRVAAFDTFMDTAELSSMGDTAKIFGTGRNRLFELLRTHKILMASNVPYQRYVNSGYFKIKKSTNNGMNFSTTLVTPKGIDFIRQLIFNNAS